LEETSFSDQGLCEVEVTIKEEMETIFKRFKELDGDQGYVQQKGVDNIEIFS